MHLLDCQFAFPCHQSFLQEKLRYIFSTSPHNECTREFVSYPSKFNESVKYSQKLKLKNSLKIAITLCSAEFSVKKESFRTFYVNTSI